MALYIVSTPIGNLKDITLRALEVLKSVDFIACEDTRVTARLLSRYNIQKPLISYHSYNKLQQGNLLIEKLKSGQSGALVSDSGTPGVSDPGSLLISQAIEAGIDISVIPGPSALLAALSASGFPSDNFYFCGFLSSKANRRKRQLEELKKLKTTVVFYEAPHRILKTLNDILEIFGDIEICLAREMTKKFEEIRREKVSLSLHHFSKTPSRGEFVIVIGKTSKK
ncbi:MAG: 16S rRNA (cytidine(1402)-2'-O)-methyltransferase [Candidatus Omnitrophota bacterium]